MIDLNYIRGFFPQPLAHDEKFQKHLVKEYMQLMILDYLATTPYITKVAFIDGTNLRLVKGINRFSEDLDFDCKELSKDEFFAMTDSIRDFLLRSGLRVETRDKENPKLTAYRRNLFFPELLFELGLTGHREERFLIKIEAQDQGTIYTKEMKTVKGCGFFFNLPTPPDSVLLSMKISALLTRAKGRDFYDVMFLMQQTKPDYDFLRLKSGVGSPEELKAAIENRLQDVDLNVKKHDFMHLLFNEHDAEKITHFQEFINSTI